MCFVEIMVVTAVIFLGIIESLSMKSFDRKKLWFKNGVTFKKLSLVR